MKRMALAVLVALAASIPGAGWTPAQSPGHAGGMTAANAMYEQGRFVDSARAYQQLVDRGYRDPVLYYNLGNAYYKQADLGRAIINYLRTRRLDPSDPDAAANLAFTRGRPGPGERCPSQRGAAGGGAAEYGPGRGGCARIADVTPPTDPPLATASLKWPIRWT